MHILPPPSITPHFAAVTIIKTSNGQKPTPEQLAAGKPGLDKAYGADHIIGYAQEGGWPYVLSTPDQNKQGREITVEWERTGYQKVFI